MNMTHAHLWPAHLSILGSLFLTVLLLVNVALFASTSFLGGQVHPQEIRGHARTLLIGHEQGAHFHAD